MAEKNICHLYCTPETHAEIKNMSDKLDVSMIKLADLIIQNTTFEDCIGYLNAEREKALNE